MHRSAGRFLYLLVLLAFGGAGCSGDATLEVPARNGTLEITTATTGSEVDGDGYTVQVDAQDMVAIGSSATMEAEVSPGNHTMRLEGLAAGCTVQGENPRIVSVVAGDTIPVSFEVSCGPVTITGTAEVHTVTTGGNPDPDGYTLAVDGGTAQPVGLNATLQLTGLVLGSHELVLAGLAFNCLVQGENSRQVTVTADTTAAISFAVFCSPPSGSSWTPMPSWTSKDLFYLSGSSTTNVFAGGVNSGCNTSFCGEVSILHYDGGAWTTQYTNSGGILGLWAAPDGQAFALVEGAQPGPILHYNGQAWSAMAVQPPALPDPNSQDITLKAIWGTSATDVFAVGSWYDGLESRGYAVHYDGTQWTSMDMGPADGIYLSDVWGSSSTDVYAVGEYLLDDAEPGDERAIIWHYNGQAWSEVLRDAAVALGHVWGTSATDVYATGSSGANGAVWHYNGSGWAPMQFPATSPLGSIWGSSSSDLYVLGREPGKIWHYDGSSWKQIDTGSSQGLADIWGSSAADIVAVGNNGTILKGP